MMSRGGEVRRRGPSLSHREEAEVRNRADTLGLTKMEKFLGENADKVPDDIKSEVEESIAELKKALEGTDTEAIKEATEKAAQVSQKMGTAIYAQTQASAAEDTSTSTADETPDDDEVVDAEIVDEDKHAGEGGAA